MKGPYLEKNLQTGLAALAELAGQVDWFDLRKDDLQVFFPQLAERTYYIGRWHLLGRDPLIIGDSGHNLAGLTGTLQAIEQMPFERLHLVLGFTAEKDIQKMLAILPTTASYYFCKADVPKGLDAQRLQSRAAAFDLKGAAYASVESALAAAKQAASPADLIFVGGSIFVLAEVL
ncbi:MAG: bifunctional folylpolyglutamate synthase/dihydrofolate synthase, partial [Phaeodactylibacter sp.]|nr:bifunctional folylpolyglutamate synthase/dihydrofolate synthase [Phaeodactylibacter sp.]